MLLKLTEKMTVGDWELEEFKQFCFMIKPLKNCPKVNLHGLLLNLKKVHSQLKPSAFGYSLDEGDSDEVQQVQDMRKKTEARPYTCSIVDF